MASFHRIGRPPVMTPTTPSDTWHRAVESGGRGEYASALTALARLEQTLAQGGGPWSPDAAALLSLSRSTRASLFRQAGRHRRAHVLDGRALAAVARAGIPIEQVGARDPARHSLTRAAAADALVGLAADNLGLLRFDAARRLLDRAFCVLDPQESGSVIGAWSRGAAQGEWATSTRCRLRWEWVSAELGLYRGDIAAGLEHARAGAELIREREAAGLKTPTRHRVKTTLIAAAATLGAGDPGGAASVARDVVRDARRHGLGPLEWAATSLLLGTGEASDDEVRRHRRLRATLVGKGMALEPEG
ncbi:hypothetical protein [Gordonia sp. 'Campus']|uniref:hypothetical protein n=1 Tax=Gordonia sp. 'Campus' TaxID=2915824 RepID=UPI0027E0B815|nr:hypothetical protein [Gordonia sp. 'Campus']